MADLLDAPELAAERIAALEKAVELNREGLRLAKSSGNTSENELRNCRSSAAWALLNLGFRMRDGKRAAESEAVLREALAISMEHIAEAPGAEPDRTRQLANIRYDLAKTLIDLGRATEAREQWDAIGAAVRVFEEKAGHAMPEFDEARRRMVELTGKFGATQEK